MDSFLVVEKVVKLLMTESVQSYLVKLILFILVLMLLFQILFRKVLVHREITESFYTSGTNKDHNVDSIAYWNQKETSF